MIIVNTHPYQTYLFKNSNIMIKFPNCPHPQCWQIDSNYLTCVIWCYQCTGYSGRSSVGSGGVSQQLHSWGCLLMQHHPSHDTMMLTWACTWFFRPGIPRAMRRAICIITPHSILDTGVSDIIRHRCRTYYQTLFFTKTYLKFLETEKSNFGDF